MGRMREAWLTHGRTTRLELRWKLPVLLLLLLLEEHWRLTKRRERWLRALRTAMSVAWRPLVVLCAPLVEALRMLKPLVLVIAELVALEEGRRRRRRRGEIWVPMATRWHAKRRHELVLRVRVRWHMLVTTAIPEAGIIAGPAWLERHRLRVHVVVHVGGGRLVANGARWGVSTTDCGGLVKVSERCDCWGVVGHVPSWRRDCRHRANGAAGLAGQMVGRGCR